MLEEISPEKMVEMMRSSTGMTNKELIGNIDTISDLLDSMGVPHFLATGFVGEEDGEITGTKSIKCKGNIHAIFEMFSEACTAEDKYLEFFIALGETMKQARETGIIDAIREARKKSSDNMKL